MSTSSTSQLTESEFIARASDFLGDRLGDGATFDADTELVGSGLLDSLAMLEFFFFIEELRGTPIDTKGFTTAAISTVRRAYLLSVAA